MESNISLVLTLVVIPGVSNGDFFFRIMGLMEKVAPSLLLITTSSCCAVLSNADKFCRASEYVKTLIVYSSNEIFKSIATSFIFLSSDRRGCDNDFAHCKKYAS